MAEYAFYMDESGSPKPSAKDGTLFFAMGGVIVRRADIPAAEAFVDEFKTNWKIDSSVPLHGSEIRSMKGNFAWIGNLPTKERERFFVELTDMLISCPVVVHACVISRRGYIDRYHERYGSDTWEMMKTAFSIVVERTVKCVALNEGKLTIFYEKSGKSEDRLLKGYFNDLRQNGCPFHTVTSARFSPLVSEEFYHRLAGIEGKSKHNKLLQIADLCLYPVAKAKENPNNRAYQALVGHGKLADHVLPPELVQTAGIKYFCYDNS